MKITDKEYNRKILSKCRDLITEYVSFSGIYIGARKNISREIDKADKSYDMYEVLFNESLNRAMRMEEKYAYRFFSDKTLDDVSHGIRNILKEQKSYGFIMANRIKARFMCSKLMRQLIETAEQKSKDSLYTARYCKQRSCLQCRLWRLASRRLARAV